MLGASGGIGQPLALLLKHSPLINHLALFDIVNTPGWVFNYILSPPLSLLVNCVPLFCYGTFTDSQKIHLCKCLIEICDLAFLVQPMHCWVVWETFYRKMFALLLWQHQVIFGKKLKISWLFFKQCTVINFLFIFCMDR